MEDHAGVFPNTYEAIRALAGVGDYTAGAISSIAFGLPVPAVDTAREGPGRFPDTRPAGG